MNNLVILKGSDVFTDSKVISDGTGNQHKSVIALVKKHKQRLERFGALRFSDLKSTNPKGYVGISIQNVSEPYREGEKMKMDKIIIASDGYRTNIMINGKVYGDNIVKVEFVHDTTQRGQGVPEYRLTTAKIPLKESATKEEFMKLLEELAKEEQ